jgi:hypothetical protein
MAGKRLIKDEVLETGYKSDKSFSESSYGSVSNGDNDIDVPVAHAIIKDLIFLGCDACLEGRVVSDVSNEHYDPLKRWKLPAQRQSITSQEH